MDDSQGLTRFVSANRFSLGSLSKYFQEEDTLSLDYKKTIEKGNFPRKVLQLYMQFIYFVGCMFFNELVNFSICRSIHMKKQIMAVKNTVGAPKVDFSTFYKNFFLFLGKTLKGAL